MLAEPVAWLVLDHQHERRFAIEPDRATGLGAVGAGITTTIADHTLDAPELREFWREAHRRRLLVLVHPTFPIDGPANDRGEYLSVGYLGETAMAAAKLTLGGVLEECPDVRIVWSHCGGGLCMVLDRIDRGYRRYEKCLRPPSEYLRQCYYRHPVRPRPRLRPRHLRRRPARLRHRRAPRAQRQQGRARCAPGSPVVGRGVGGGAQRHRAQFAGSLLVLAQY